MNKNIKIAKQLIKLAKSLVAENNFQKLQNWKNRLKQLNQQLIDMQKQHQQHYDLMKELLEYLKNTDDPQPNDKKAIKNLEQGKYHLIRDSIIEKRNPELYNKINNIYFPYMKDYPKHEESLKRKIEQQKLKIQDLQHKIGGKLNLLNSTLPDDFEEAMENLKQSCINYIKQDIYLNIKNYTDILNDNEKLWSIITENRSLSYQLYFFEPEEIKKIRACKTFDEFKSKLNNDEIIISYSFLKDTPKQNVINKIINILEKKLNENISEINKKIQFEQSRNAEKQGEYWYKQQRIKLLGELAEYCDDIISADGLSIARNGEFNVTVTSSNGVFRVLTSGVIGHHRYQGYAGLVWVRPHWRLTVRRVNK